MVAIDLSVKLNGTFTCGLEQWTDTLVGNYLFSRLFGQFYYYTQMGQKINLFFISTVLITSHSLWRFIDIKYTFWLKKERSIDVLIDFILHLSLLPWE
jgi:hypothetical protein